MSTYIETPYSSSGIYNTPTGYAEEQYSAIEVQQAVFISWDYNQNNYNSDGEAIGTPIFAYGDWVGRRFYFYDLNQIYMYDHPAQYPTLEGYGLNEIWETLRHSYPTKVRYKIEGTTQTLEPVNSLPNWIKSAVRDLYLELLLREPEEAGWSYWGTQINTGAMQLSQVRAAIINSNEYKEKHPTTTNPDGTTNKTDGTTNNKETIVIPSETRVYVYTYVSAYGEEGVPSPASSTVDVKNGQYCEITNMAGAPSGPYNITSKRLYRSNTGSSGAIYQFVTELPIGTSTYTDNTLGTDLGEENTSGSYDMPEAEMVGLTSMANGILAGFMGNSVCFSEAFMPHAWPIDYRLSTQHKIVGIGAFGQSLAVLTESYPYIASGVDPSGMTLEKLPLQQACASRHSIVEMADGVIYASPDGLFSIGSSGIQNLTASIMTREEWQSYNPSSILGAQYDSRYFAFYDNGTKQGCLLFSFNGVEPTFCTLDIHATATYNDPLTDTLYLSKNGQITKFNYGTPLTYTWRSKLFLVPRPQNFGCAQVLSKSYPVTFKFFADGQLKHTQSVASTMPFRLPSGFLCTEVEFQVEGSNEIEQVTLANTMSELSEV